MTLHGSVSKQLEAPFLLHNLRQLNITALWCQLCLTLQVVQRARLAAICQLNQLQHSNASLAHHRLRQAHKCSQISSKPAYARPTDIEAGGGDVAAQDDEAAQRIHAQFMQMAMQLIDGRMDSSQYEDSCRQLLGQVAVTVSCMLKPQMPAQALLPGKLTKPHVLAMMPEVRLHRPRA